jgi:3-oxoacyl-[acyl-carrier protein] reductase
VTADADLAGAVAVVVGGTATVGGRIAAALRAQGAAVVVTDAVDRDSVEAAFVEAGTLGRVEMAVHAHVPAVALVPAELVAVDDATWDAATDAPVLATLTTLQAARRHLVGGGRVLVVVPSVGLTGLAWHVPLCTVAEAQRAVAKSAARSWGGAGITVNVLAVELADLGGPAESAPAIRSSALPAWEGDDVGAHATWLLRRDAHRATGLTLVADGGATMLP